MRHLRHLRHLLALLFLLLAVPAHAADEAADEAVIEGIQEYMEFTSYGDGALSSAQLRDAGLDSFFIVDARTADRYEAGHIGDAINIEWRQILAHVDELPTDRAILLYCDTGLLSAKAQFALRIAGFDKANVLQGGYPAWVAENASASK